MRDAEGKTGREAEPAGPASEPQSTRRSAGRTTSREPGRSPITEGTQEAARIPIPESAEPGVEPRSISETEIRELAYEMYVSRGATDGHDLDDWYAAERELRARLPEQRRRGSSSQTSI